MHSFKDLKLLSSLEFFITIFQVLVEPVVSIPSCNRISMDPVSANDWEILVSLFRLAPLCAFSMSTKFYSTKILQDIFLFN